jgi:hypothetical protein
VCRAAGSFREYPCLRWGCSVPVNSGQSSEQQAATPAKTHRHHVVPKFYLRGFVDANRRLWEYDRTNPEVHAVATTPNRASVLLDYHKLNGPNPDAYEELLALTEWAAAPIIARARARQPIDSSHKYALALFVAFMKYRSPGYVEQARETQEQVMNMILQLKQRHDPTMPQGDFRIKMDRTGVYAALSPTAAKLAEHLCRMRWAFETTDRDNPFLTSDSPVAVIDPSKTGVAMWRTTIFMSEESELTCPLSPDTALICGWKLRRDCAYAPVPTSLVRDVNKRSITMATRFVWADRKSTSIAKLVEKYP